MKGLYYERYGSGRPLLFIHGFGANLNSWKLLVPYLKDYCELILVDLKGFGASPKPRDGRYAVKDHVEALDLLMRTLKLEDVVVVGNSFGGGIALELTLATRGDSTVTGLILLDPAAYYQKLPWPLRLLVAPILSKLLFVLPPTLAVRMSMGAAYYDRKAISPEIVKAYTRPFAEKSYVYALKQTARQLPSASEVALLESMYPSIAIPTLILWGAHDKMIPCANGERLHAQITSSVLIVLKDCGHAPQEEVPAATANAILKFLATTPSGSAHKNSPAGSR